MAKAYTKECDLPVKRAQKDLEEVKAALKAEKKARTEELESLQGAKGGAALQKELASAIEDRDTAFDRAAITNQERDTALAKVVIAIEERNKAFKSGNDAS